MPPNTAASPSRSRLESRKAPQLLVRPLDLAIWPSMPSASTKTVTQTAPCQSHPCGKQISAPTSTPSVPITVTVSGEMPHLLNRFAGGAITAAQTVRKRSSIGSGLPGRRCRVGRLLPGAPEHLPGLPEQLRQRLGLADHREEVRVAAPPRDDVLVQVGGDPGACDIALVDAEVEAVRGAGVAD